MWRWCRGLHSMTAIGSKLWLFGGAPQKGPMMDDLWVLDTQTLEWRQIDKPAKVLSPSVPPPVPAPDLKCNHQYGHQ